MNDVQENGPMLLEELEVVVGGLTRPWAGAWQPADVSVAQSPSTSADAASSSPPPLDL